MVICEVFGQGLELRKEIRVKKKDFLKYIGGKGFKIYLVVFPRTGSH